MTAPPVASPSTHEIRTRILDVATQLFSQRGYGSTSVRELAEAAGVTKPTLYYHFGNKEGLFLAAVRAQMDIETQLFRESVAAPGTVQERLAAFASAAIEKTHQNPSGSRLMFTAEHRPEQGQPEIDLMSSHLQNIELLQTLFVEGIEAGELRPDIEPLSAVISFIGAVHLRCMAALYEYPLPDDVVGRIIDLFFEGVAKK